MKMMTKLFGFTAAWMVASLVVNGCVCVVHHHDARRPTPVYVAGPPPPAKAEDRPPASSDSHVWVGGYWDWNQVEEEWEWSEGSWETPPAEDATWEEPSYQESDGDWIFTPGHWSRPEVIEGGAVEMLPGYEGTTDPADPIGPGPPVDLELPADPVEPADDPVEDEGEEDAGETPPATETSAEDEEQPSRSAKPPKATKVQRPDTSEEHPSRSAKPPKATKVQRPDTSKAAPKGAGKVIKPGKSAKEGTKGAGKVIKPGKPAKEGTIDPEVETDKKPALKGGSRGKSTTSGRIDRDKKCVKSRDCNCDGVCDPHESKDCADCR